MKGQILFIPLLLLLFACNCYETEKKHNCNAEYVMDNYYQVKPRNLELTYTLDESPDTNQQWGIINDKDNPRINLTLKNNNNHSIYYLSGTYNEIPGELIMIPSTIRQEQDIYCNVSYPLFVEVKPKRTHKFSTNLRLKGEKLKSVELQMFFANKPVSDELLHQYTNFIIDNYQHISEETILLAKRTQ